MQPLSEGARQRRRMDAAKPLGAGPLALSIELDSRFAADQLS